MAQEGKPRPNPFDALTHEERAAAVRAELYHTHKVRGSLGTFYQMYPDLAPPSYWQRDRTDDGRQR